MLFVSRLLGTAAFVCVVASAVGCTDPQSGIFAADWCKPSLAGATEVIDDFEDKDLIPCARKGRWYVGGTGTVDPLPAMFDEARELPTARQSSVRALRLGGAVAAGQASILGVSLADRTLRDFQEIRFWAKSDEGPLQVQVALLTATTAGDGDHFVDVVTLSTGWGDQGNEATPNSIALTGLTRAQGQVAITDEDRASCQALEFQVVTESPSFAFWIDDLQLIPKP